MRTRERTVLSILAILLATGVPGLGAQREVAPGRTFERPYTAVLDLESQESIYEYACHEGNRGLENILRAARAEERAAASAR